MRHGKSEPDPTLAHATRDEITVCEPSRRFDQRIWCGFEIYTSLIKSTAEEARYLYDIYTSLSCKSPGAVGLTDGLAIVDLSTPFEAGQLRRKCQREHLFPVTLAETILRTRVQDAEASVASDKRHILNSIAGAQDLDEQPLENHENYERVNHLLRGRFAVGVWRAAVDARNYALCQKLSAALCESGLDEIKFELAECGRLTHHMGCFTPALCGNIEVRA